jgi:hypothetical protein
MQRLLAGDPGELPQAGEGERLEILLSIPKSQLPMRKST